MIFGFLKQVHSDSGNSHNYLGIFLFRENQIFVLRACILGIIAGVLLLS
jgi:hypothetical protein